MTKAINKTQTDKIRALNLTEILSQIHRLPRHSDGMTVVTRLLEAGVDYQDLARAACPTVSDLRIGGIHISTASELLRTRAFTNEDTFAEEPEILVALVQLQPNQVGTPGMRYYAGAPAMFSKSADYIFVGEYIDVPGMAAKNDFWRKDLLGVKSPNYVPGAATGTPESIEWLSLPNTKAGMEPKELRRALDGSKPAKFLTAADMQTFLASVPPTAQKAKADVLTADDILSAYGIL